jgi:uncharacterized membrane protein (UPF0127 family)
MRYAIVNNSSKNYPYSIKTLVCDNFWSKFIGLMGHKPLQAHEGLLFVETKAGRLNSSIHMMFMSFDIAVIWVDETCHVIDKIIAKKWQLFYAPRRPALYTLELHSSNYDEFIIGDLIKINYA